MKVAWRLVEADAYERARKQALTRRPGKPTRTDWIMWQKQLEVIAAGYDVSDTYEWTVDAAGNNYGCLFLTVDPDDVQYELRTGITTYVEPEEPPHYHEDIDVNTPTFQRKQLEEENEQKKHDFFTMKGALRGMAENLRDAMGEQYYSQLEHSVVGYKNVTVLQIMKHLDTEWVPMNTKERRAIKKEYFKPWDVAGGVALSKFTKALDERRSELHIHNITIEDEDVKEHYIVQMYESNAFSEADMKQWEDKTEAEKDDWAIMKRFFRDKMALNEAYNNNNEGNSAALYGSSANVTEQEEKLADMGDKIREYIQQLTGAKENVPPPSNYSSNTSSNKATDELNKRMLKIEELLTTLTFANNKNRGGGGDDKDKDDKDRDKRKGRSRRNRDEPETRHRNMGGYCHSCGFHPVGKEHTSETCGFKRREHDKDATWTNRGTNGSVYWPNEWRVRDDEKTHASYAGKSAPTN